MHRIIKLIYFLKMSKENSSKQEKQFYNKINCFFLDKIERVNEKRGKLLLKY